MKWDKLKPWNWFRHEEETDRGSVPLPVEQGTPSSVPAPTDPFAAFWNSWQRQFDQMLQHSFRSLPGMPAAGTFRPSLDLADEGDHYRISLEAPGMDADDLSIRVDRDRLIIEGEKQQQHPAGDTAYYRVERYYGAFQRVLSLPEDADPDRIDASLRDGVLTLTIARHEDRQPARQIRIEH